MPWLSIPYLYRESSTARSPPLAGVEPRLTERPIHTMFAHTYIDTVSSRWAASHPVHRPELGSQQSGRCRLTVVSRHRMYVQRSAFRRGRPVTGFAGGRRTASTVQLVASAAGVISTSGKTRCVFCLAEHIISHLLMSGRAMDTSDAAPLSVGCLVGRYQHVRPATIRCGIFERLNGSLRDWSGPTPGVCS